MTDRTLNRPVSPPSERIAAVAPGVYRVVAGDTLYSIAWRYGKDFRAMARANGIGTDYRIFPGQLLRLTESAPVVLSERKTPVKEITPSVTRDTSANASSAKASSRPVDPPAAIKKPVSTGDEKPVTVSKGRVAIERASSGSSETLPPLRWRWPAQGKVMRGFSSRGKVNNGLDIAGHRGDPVFAAAPGRVVYAGSSLRGYGNLIIINHNEQYLSAYAHNSKMLVKEEQQVVMGQKIAEIGDSGAERTMLHFEIRKDGKPVNPLRYLPKR